MADFYNSLGIPASIRYNNPGAQYPSSAASGYGQTGYGIIGGGHKIAAFPDPVSGAAANFDLLNRGYTGIPIGEAGRKWTGGSSLGVPGFASEAILTRDMLADPNVAIPLMKSIARREAGRDSPLTDEQWREAHKRFLEGAKQSPSTAGVLLAGKVGSSRDSGGSFDGLSPFRVAAAEETMPAFSAPQGGGVPMVDFSTLGNLPATYRKAQARAYG